MEIPAGFGCCVFFYLLVWSRHPFVRQPVACVSRRGELNALSVSFSLQPCEIFTFCHTLLIHYNFWGALWSKPLFPPFLNVAYEL